MNRLENLLGLNEEQRNILSDEARIAIEAGAGSGKTRSLVAKYLQILESGKAPVDQIVAITFTNNAARELKRKIRENIEAYIKQYGERGYISRDSLRRLSTAPVSTIHGFSSRIIKENPFDSKISASFSIIDENEKDEFFDQRIKEFVLAEIKDGNKNIKDLLEMEGYDYRELVTIIKTVLFKSSLLHLEPPFPGYRAENDTVPLEEIDFKIPEELVTAFTDTLGGRSSGMREEILEVYSNISSDLGFNDNFKKIVFISGKLRRKEPYKNEIKESARVSLLEYIDVIIDCINHHISKLYLEVSNEAFEYIQNKKLEIQVLDFEDQIRYTYRLLSERKDLLDHYRERFKYIIVDEFQDTDKLQYNLLVLLTTDTSNRLIVVGDKKQSIYSFRGGEPVIFENVLSDPSYSNYSLKSNYRSNKVLINFFNDFFVSVFSDNYESMIHRSEPGESEEGIEFIITSGSNHEDARTKEINKVCDKVEELISSGDYTDIALLFRNSKNAAKYERELRLRNISFNSDFGSGFFRLQEIRDLVSMLKYLINPGDMLSRISVLRSVFFGASDAAILKYLSGNYRGDDEIRGIYEYLDFLNTKRQENIYKDPLSIVNFIMNDLGYSPSMLAMEDGRNKLLNTRKFYNICEKLTNRGYGLSDIIEYFDNSRDSGSGNKPNIENTGRTIIRLTTVHRSKGLEFDVVILCDANYRTVPNAGRVAGDADTGFFIRYGNSRSGSWDEISEYQKLKEQEDEKRLLYVAKTRARKKLVVALSSHSGKDINRYYSGSFASLIQNEIGFAEDEDPENIEYGELTISRYTGSKANKKINDEPEENRLKVTDFTSKNIDKLYSGKISGEGNIPDISPFSEKGITKSNAVDSGEIMHRFLEVWDFEPDNLTRCIEFVLNEAYISDHDFGDELRKLASYYHKSELSNLISNANRIYREYGFVVDIGGVIHRGRIDLLVDHSDGRVLVDYKYRKSVNVDEFREQLDLYSYAVERKFGSAPSKRFIVLLPSLKMVAI